MAHMENIANIQNESKVNDPTEMIYILLQLYTIYYIFFFIKLNII